jgi:hypothetical protein
MIAACATMISLVLATAPATRVIDVPVPQTRWPWWQTGPLVVDPDAPRATPRTTFIPVRRDGAGPQVFSGRVEGVASYDNVQVGVISLLTVHRHIDSAFEWVDVKADGRFAVLTHAWPDQAKAVCVRAPGHPWTYLPHDFRPGESAGEIVLRSEEGRAITITAGVQNASPPQPGYISVDVYDAFLSLGPFLSPLRQRYYGARFATDGAVTMVLPARKVGLLIRADGCAPSNAVVDPRESPRFHFRLAAAGGMHGVVSGRSGPIGRAVIGMFNPNIPFSITAAQSEGDGSFHIDGLTPGPYRCWVRGHGFDVIVREGQTSEVTLDVSTPTPQWYDPLGPRWAPMVWRIGVGDDAK